MRRFPPTSEIELEQRQENLSPVINRAVDAAYFQYVVAVVNFELLIAASALEQVARASPPSAFLVVCSNLRLSETGCIVHVVGSSENLHGFPLILIC